jgi:hypothetical protein
MTFPTRDLRYSIDVYDARGNWVEHLAELDDLDPARAAFAALCAKYPAKFIFMRERARVIARSDEPPAWMAAHRPIPVFRENPVDVPAQARGLRPLLPEERPQDPSMDGRGLKILKTMEHGGEYPDMMANAIRIGDAQGRSAVYVALKIDGKVVDSE